MKDEPKPSFNQVPLFVSHTLTSDRLKLPSAAKLVFNLRTIRLSKGIAQERLALDAGVDRTVVSKIERAVANPSIEILLKLDNQLDVD